MFRHSGIYINTAAGITGPADLPGRTVGVAEYQLSPRLPAEFKGRGERMRQVRDDPELRVARAAYVRRVLDDEAARA